MERPPRGHVLQAHRPSSAHTGSARLVTGDDRRREAWSSRAATRRSPVAGHRGNDRVDIYNGLNHDSSAPCRMKTFDCVWLRRREEAEAACCIVPPPCVCESVFQNVF
ncbi:hypothetical protein F2P81_002946 [Scophthalmus maximus]|uniref:Uncharacterized protein n=1 Tax=Scophthalmus maximus TaxID=52904 RepID=A0A6A4TH57_SCOMX|nr:hypothetical protein F2P81_002946 [Scophthalmus maximus]